MSIETDARQEAERRWPVEGKTTIAWASRRVGFEAGAVWAHEQDTREPSDAEVIAALNAWQDRTRPGTSLGEWGSFKVARMRAALLAAQEVRRGD